MCIALQCLSCLAEIINNKTEVRKKEKTSLQTKLERSLRCKSASASTRDVVVDFGVWLKSLRARHSTVAAFQHICDDMVFSLCLLNSKLAIVYMFHVAAAAWLMFVFCRERLLEISIGVIQLMSPQNIAINNWTCCMHTMLVFFCHHTHVDNCWNSLFY